MMLLAVLQPYAVPFWLGLVGLVFLACTRARGDGWPSWHLLAGLAVLAFAFAMALGVALVL